MSGHEQNKLSPIVFLGFCERAAHVPDVASNVLKWNVLGLRNVILSNIFPLPMSGWSAGFALATRDYSGDINLEIVDEATKEVGKLTVQLYGPDPATPETYLRDQGSLMYVPEYGHYIAFFHLSKLAWVVNKPGSYYIEHVNGSERTRIGALLFVAVEPPPLTAERIGAIKSDPTASKFARIELGCKTCDSKLKVYTGIEKSEKSEKDGWIWYQDIPLIFNCSCGKTSMDLQYLKQNMHGIIGKRFSGREDLSFVPMYERSSIQVTIERFGKLIEANHKEEIYQQFIEENPIVLHQFPADKIIHKPKILNSYVADFGVVTSKKELILIEIEKPSTKLMKAKGDVAAELSHAFDQVRNWLHTVNDHRLAVLDELGIEKESVSTIRGVVIAGRDVGHDARNLRKLRSMDFGVAFMTYDDLLFSMESLLKKIESI